MVQRPSEIRTIILGEHRELRERLAEIVTNLSRATAEPNVRAELQQQLARFYEKFLLHIEHEEQILRPVLADIDNWGPIRIQQMDEEHVEQRELIRELSRLLPDPDLRAYSERIRAFVLDVLADMDAEERECLSKDVLRDDTTSIDAFGG
jgi:hemerythrin-like domain-containing protein